MTNKNDKTQLTNYWAFSIKRKENMRVKNKQKKKTKHDMPTSSLTLSHVMLCAWDRLFS